MHAERAPFFGIVIAVLLLVTECVGLLAYKLHEQSVEQDRIAQRASARAVQDATAAKAKIDELMAEIDRLDHKILRLEQRIDLRPQPMSDEELARLRERLESLRQERAQIGDFAIRAERHVDLKPRHCRD